MFVEQAEPVLRGLGLMHLISHAPQSKRDHVPDGRFVFDYQDFYRHRLANLFEIASKLQKVCFVRAAHACTLALPAHRSLPCRAAPHHSSSLQARVAERQHARNQPPPLQPRHITY